MLMQVKMSIADDSLAQAGQFEIIGDHLYECRPDLACWFYRQFHEFAQSASYKLGIVNARLQTLRANSLAEGDRNPPVFVSIGHEMICKLDAYRQFRVHIGGNKVRLVQTQVHCCFVSRSASL